jgi:hypothetical protein
MKRKKGKTKLRQDSVYGTVNVGDDRTLTVSYDWQTDAIEIVGADAKSTRTERSYERTSGKPKIVSSIPSDGKSTFTAKRALFAYEYVVAVDTNTRMLFGKRCAVSVSYFTPKPPATYGPPGVPFICLAAYLIVGIKNGVNPEQIGWHLTITRNLSRPIPSHHRIALVVDSELDSHREINERRKGYYMGNTLPHQITLVYSSADVDNETLGGVMIRMCDQMASRIFEQIQKTKIPPPINESIDANFEALYSLPVTREGGSLGIFAQP